MIIVFVGLSRKIILNKSMLKKTCLIEIIDYLNCYGVKLKNDVYKLKHCYARELISSLCCII